MTAFTDLLANPNAVRHWAVIAEPRDRATGENVTLRYSTNGLRTAPTDTPASTYFAPRLAAGPTFNQSLVNGARLRGPVSVDYGILPLRNGDIGDGRTIDAIRAYNWRGARVRCYMGGEGFAFADYGLVYDAISDGIEPSTALMAVRLRDRRYLLDKPVLTETFAGTGTWEGPATLTGRKKPLIVGEVLNYEPIYVGVIGGLHTHFWSIGEMEGVTALRQAGSSITLVSGTPTTGQYAMVTNASGTFTQLGSASIEGVIAGDASGALDENDDYPTSAADICAWLFRTRTAFTSADIRTGTVDALNTKNDAAVGWVVTDEMTFNDLFATLLGSIGAHQWFGRDGLWIMGRLEAPATSAATFGRASAFDPIRELAPAPQVHKVRLGWGRNWRPMSDAEIAPAVSAANRVILAADWQWAEDSEADVLDEDPDAEELVIQTALTDGDDAAAEASRLLALHGAARRLLPVTVASQPLASNLLDTATVELPRLGLDDGFDGVIVALDEQGGSNRVAVVLWG